MINVYVVFVLKLVMFVCQTADNKLSIIGHSFLQKGKHKRHSLSFLKVIILTAGKIHMFFLIISLVEYVNL